MVSIQNLTPFSETCLKLFLERFPEFEPYVCASNFDNGTWQAEMSWPDGWAAAGLRACTWVSMYGEGFRVDIGNWHTHFENLSEDDSFEFLDEVFEFIDDFLNERLVMIAKWRDSSGFFSKIEGADYIPVESDWIRFNVVEIWRRSWKGTYNREWRLSSRLSAQ